MTETSVRPCSCGSGFQDSRYGRGKRVFNRGKDSWICTVCGRTESAPTTNKDEKK